MAGIYIHIPFCKQACHYCDFHFSTKLDKQSSMVSAIVKEIKMRKDYLQNSPIGSIYFGGGTPSILSIEELTTIIESITGCFELSSDIEITIEANPDDISEASLAGWRDIGINRLSIGVQSFDEDELKFMNRSHDAKQSLQSLLWSKQYFDNISADLIFCGQYTKDSVWKSNVEKMIDLGIQHLSCYSLTIEENTVFDNWLKKGKLEILSDNQQKAQFIFASETLQNNGYTHYEISNYAKDGYFSYHNTNYWKDEAYLGIGPSAHSYNGISRQWNEAHNHNYVNALNTNQAYYTIEELSIQDKFNEYILTSLRTMWGTDLNKIKSYGEPYYIHLTKAQQEFLASGDAEVINNHLVLTTTGKLFADKIASSLFYIA